MITVLLLSLSGSLISELVVFLHQWWPWPASGLFNSGFGVDKVVHTGLFAICGALFFRGWDSLRQKWWILGSYLIVLGAVTEILQTVIPERNADVLDLVANSIGVFFGIAVAYLYLRFRRRV